MEEADPQLSSITGRGARWQGRVRGPVLWRWGTIRNDTGARFLLGVGQAFQPDAKSQAGKPDLRQQLTATRCEWERPAPEGGGSNTGACGSTGPGAGGELRSLRFGFGRGPVRAGLQHQPVLHPVELA